MLIAIGSQNRVKIKAVQNVFYPDHKVIARAAQSSARPQPLSDEETAQGATERALDCLQQTTADLTLGLEGGVFFKRNRVFLCNWGALINRSGCTLLSQGPVIELPQELKSDFLQGLELAEIMEQRYHKKGIRTQEGAVGFFTHGALTREAMFTHIVQLLWIQYLKLPSYK